MIEKDKNELLTLQNKLRCPNPTLEVESSLQSSENSSNSSSNQTNSQQDTNSESISIKREDLTNTREKNKEGQLMQGTALMQYPFSSHEVFRQSNQVPTTRNNQDECIQLIDLGNTVGHQKAGTALASSRKQRENPQQVFQIGSENHRSEPHVNLLIRDTPSSLEESKKIRKWKQRLTLRKSEDFQMQK